jgi:hypothetical protein
MKWVPFDGTHLKLRPLGVPRGILYRGHAGMAHYIPQKNEQMR